MRVGLDTGFFVKLLQGDTRTQRIYEKILNGQTIGVISTLVIFELKRLSLKGGIIDRDAYELLEKSLTFTFEIVPLDFSLALEAAKISHGTGLPTADAIIYTAYKVSGCKQIYTTDSDLKNFKGKIEVEVL